MCHPFLVPLPVPVSPPFRGRKVKSLIDAPFTFREAPFETAAAFLFLRTRPPPFAERLSVSFRLNDRGGY